MVVPQNHFRIFGFWEDYKKVVVTTDLTTMKQPKTGPPFQLIRNRSLNKEMYMRTSWKTVIFFRLVSFDPKFLAVFKNFLRFLYG